MIGLPFFLNTIGSLWNRKGAPRFRWFTSYGCGAPLERSSISNEQASCLKNPQALGFPLFRVAFFF
jgi:hypothetical protein